MTPNRRAVIDIGSNTIRLVVYAGSARSPVPIFNEKNRIGLGACLIGNGVIDEKTMSAALRALARFHAIAQGMEINELRIVATAATREAKNGHELIARAAEIGIPIEVLDGNAEARASGLGIISEFPGANGYVGDLGGGSLELIRIRDGNLDDAISVPLGTLRHRVLKNKSAKQIAQLIRDELDKAVGKKGFPIETDLPFYMIGGSWRAFARLHIEHSHYPLAILSHYQMPPSAPADLTSLVSDPGRLAQQHVVPSARLGSLPGSTALLGGIARLFKSSSLVTSIHGLREGLLFDTLDEQTKALDPLLAAARFEGGRLGRFNDHGDALADWLGQLFADKLGNLDRLCRAACLLSDSVWQVNPEYRAEDAMKIALDGNWPGVSASDRALIAMALFAAHAGNASAPEILTQLTSKGALETAMQWGLAIRLAQRLDGGTGKALASAQLMRKRGTLTLLLSGDAQALVSDGVERRLVHLATAIGCSDAILLA